MAKAGGCLSVAILWICCVAASPQDADPLRSSFLLLGSLENLLHFPANQAALDACAERGDKSCLALYGNARHAVDQLFDSGRAEALKRTLDAVRTECRSPSAAEGQWSMWQACKGAVAAFYFFSTDAEDRSILRALQRMDKTVIRNIFVESRGYAGDWPANRPDKRRWISFLRSVDGLKQDPEWESAFVRPAPPQTGIALLDPRRR
jgi:hypothetical protein